MSKRIRQYAGLLAAIISYYIIHEGAHFIYALMIGTFKSINIMGLGIQIDVFNEKMTDLQMGIFCIVGSLATLIAGYILVAMRDKIAKSDSKMFKACMYYITIIMLFLDPLYLSLLCGFVGGGDMNGITYLAPEFTVRISYGLIFILNAGIFIQDVLPRYKTSFSIVMKPQMQNKNRTTA